MTTTHGRSLARLGTAGIWLAVTLMLSACASAPRVSSGFIEEELDFRPVEGRENAYVWISPALTAADAERYCKIMLEPISVWYSPQSPYRGIHPEELKLLTDYLHRAVVVELSDQLPLTDQPGEDVLRLRLAITDLVREKPSSILTERPGGLALSGSRAQHGPTVLSEQELVSANSFFLAGSLEAELLDSVSGDLIGAYKEARASREVATPDGAVTWGRVREVMDEWAVAIRQQLDVEMMRLKANVGTEP